MNNEIEKIAQQNEMSIEFVTWFFAEKKSGCGNVWFMMMAAMWEGWKGRGIEMDKLAAENAALKAGVTYFAYSPEYGFDYFKDKQSAIDTAQEEIDAYREDADDGWSEDVQRVSWGIVIQQAQGFDAQGLHTSDSQHTYQTCDYRLVDSVETPATDRIYAGIKADGRAEGINLAAGRLAAAFNHGFVDKPMAEVFDVVRMILTAKEDLASNPAEDGLSGEYAEKSLAEWEAVLREGADK